jgi:hypothetical protein
VNRLGQFWHYTRKVFALPVRLRSVVDERPQAEVPAGVITASLLLGVITRAGSLLQLQFETQRRGWQKLIGWAERISDDCFVYALERARISQLRDLLVSINRTLKTNKQFERAKIGGLLVVAIDANEQFKSRSRCCSQCARRQFEEKGPDGQMHAVTEYYHRQVYAHINGPAFSAVLDVEPIEPGEDESAAALRMLGRMRRLYGARFFDAVTVDAWYTSGPFIKAVELLGWAVVSVLKQERYQIHQEATALSKRQPPKQWQWEDRTVRLWDIRDLEFTDQKVGLVRVVLADEQWQQNTRVAGKKVVLPRQSHWRWLVSAKLANAAPELIWQIGHRRWGIENHTFNELTTHYRLEHCRHHHPVAILAFLLLLVLGFTLFEVFGRVHSKLCRGGKATLKQIAREIDHAIEALHDIEPLWSG